ncbi:MAG: tRNA pseudouridine(38-40) synthase TruA [Beijerinckiaceae bacterium]|nr:tRNA pseudouridine(38-40) synthase TruA [Beijerinckiaceae bacterium]
MPRYKLLIEYDGTSYCGWQRQARDRSVQSAIEEAIEGLTTVFTTLHGCGRTDAGVHALGQVAHFTCVKRYAAGTVRDALNARLKAAGDAVTILAADEVDDSFDARLSATKRHYLYRIVNRRPPLALDEHRAWHVKRPLDVEAMQESARYLLGHHDFTTFRSADCQANSPLRTLDTLDVTRDGERVEIRTSARSFLHHQVRSFAGSLVEVGLGKWPPIGMKEALEARDRARCGPQAPAAGLYFVKAEY